MTKEKISEKEIPLILKKFNKSLWLSLLVFPFILIVVFLPVYFLFYFGILLFRKEVYDDLLTIYVVVVIGLVIINFLYGKLVINRKIRNRNIHRINENFIVQKKDNYTYTSDTVSNSDYFRLYLSDEKNNPKGIYISKEDFQNITVGQSINLTYYAILDIPADGFNNGQKLDFFRFFSVNKWKELKRKLTF